MIGIFISEEVHFTFIVLKILIEINVVPIKVFLQIIKDWNSKLNERASEYGTLITPRTSIGLPGVQQQLAQKLASPKLVVVYINGGPVSSKWIKQNVETIIEAWYPGEQGGQAIVDV